MAYRLPQKVSLPWGYEIIVELVEPMEDCYGEWDTDTRTIRIEKTLTVPERRAILLHEMGHAYLDWTNWVAKHIPLKEPHPTPQEVDDGDGSEDNPA